MARVHPESENETLPDSTPTPRFTARQSVIDDTTQRGITFAQLEEVLAEIDERCDAECWTRTIGGRIERVTPDTCNLHDFVEHVLLPKTREPQCSFVELVASAPQLATVFVSHCWGEPVRTFVGCLRQFVYDTAD